MSQVHVLAVDDSVVDRKVIERLLKAFACKVTTVENGKRALEILGVGENSSSLTTNCGNLQECQVDLVITDYCMPGMSGYDLLKKIKGTTVLKEIPVVVLSSENVPNRIKRCLAEGAKEFILKPVQLADIERLKSHACSTGMSDLFHQCGMSCTRES